MSLTNDLNALLSPIRDVHKIPVHKIPGKLSYWYFLTDEWNIYSGYLHLSFLFTTRALQDEI